MSGKICLCKLCGAECTPSSGGRHLCKAHYNEHMREYMKKINTVAVYFQALIGDNRFFAAPFEKREQA